LCKSIASDGPWLLRRNCPACSAACPSIARRAHERARHRQCCANAALIGVDIDRLCRPTGAIRQLLQSAGSRLGGSARAHHRVLKVAATVADLDDADALATAHVAEAIQYRRSLRER